MIARSLAAAALAAALTAPALHAQHSPSAMDGLVLGVHVNGTTLDPYIDSDEHDAGGGLGVLAGYQFRSGLGLYVEVEGAEMEPEDGGAGYAVANVDVGVRYNFGAGYRALVPYLLAALNGTVLMEDDVDDTRYSGGGLTVGGGVQYFVTRSLALDAGFRASSGAFQTMSVQGDDQDVEEWPYAGSRLVLGVVWRP